MELQCRCIGGRDLSVDFQCDCPHPDYQDNEALKNIMKTRIYLSGYNDDYFFREVNKYPRNFKCHNCGKEYRQQWFKDGTVHVYEGC